MDFIDKFLINGFIIAFGFLFSFSGIQKEVATAYALLLTIDYITGLMASYKAKELLTSDRMIRGGLYKIALLGLLFALGFFSKMTMLSQEITNIIFVPIIIMLATGELFSIVANVHCVKTGKRHKEQVVITDYILRYLKRWLDKKFGDDK
ncbi:Holin family protein [Aliarcobacter thereius]|uniref:Holin family protein n=1 Tax=Aliarcobacter thereius TaxID=544718 RepID=A0A1C0B7H3_9BACT|nr:phage holin family protein [Aliarcobacter thereius]OCL99511.1 Holin family protein [Aliarcobacter thereius]